MPPATPTKAPKKIVQGTEVAWLIDLQADGWTPTLYKVIVGFVKDDGSDNIATGVTATDNGDGRFLVTLLTAVTAGMAVGTWKFQTRVELTADATGRTIVNEGRIDVRPDMIASATDNRTHAKKTLDAIEATLVGKASTDQLGYSINGRSLSRMSPTELREWRAAYRAEVAEETAAEEAEQGRKTGSKILARM